MSDDILELIVEALNDSGLLNSFTSDYEIAESIVEKLEENDYEIVDKHKGNREEKPD